MDSHSPFAALLLGQPTLRRRTKLGTFAALDQRIALRYAMTGMTHQETASYLSHHLKLAGRPDTLFSDDATALIHQVSSANRLRSRDGRPMAPVSLVVKAAKLFGMSTTAGPNDGFEVVVGSDGTLSVPADELARHGVRPGAHLRLVPDVEYAHARVSAFGYVAHVISPDATDALAEGIDAGRTDRADALELL